MTSPSDVRQRLLIDLDSTVVDLWEEAGARGLLNHRPCKWDFEGCCSPFSADYVFGHENIFRDAKPIVGAIQGVEKLMKRYDVHFVSTPWPSAHNSAEQKYAWVEYYFDDPKLLTLTHRKDLIPAWALIDDRPLLKGPWIHVEYPQLWNHQSNPSWTQGLADYITRIL